MKGLIYRELYLAKKSYITGIFVTLAVMLVGILVRLSTVYGNLAKLDEDSFTITDTYTFYIFMFLPLIAALNSFMGDKGIIIEDSKCRFNVFAYTLPVSEVQLASVKYIILVCSAAVSFVLGTINAAVICGISGKPLTANIMKVMLIITAVHILFYSLCIPLITKFKSNASADALCIGLVGIVVLILREKMIRWSTQFVDETGELDAEALIGQFVEKAAAIRDIASVCAPFVIIVFLAAGFAATVILYKRRAK